MSDTTKPVMADYACPECGADFQHYNITFDTLKCVNGHTIPTILAVPRKSEDNADEADSSATQEDTGQ